MHEEITFTQLAEEALSEDHVDHFEGNLKSFDELLQEETLVRLDESFQGIFGVIIYDPPTDTDIRKFIDSGFLSNDSPDSLIVLHCPKEFEKPEIQIGDSTFLGAHPSYSFARSLFASSNKSPNLPGIILLERLSVHSEPLFVSLLNLDSESIRPALSKLFRLSDEIFKESGRDEFSKKLANRLANSELRKMYLRLDSLSPKEAFLHFWSSVIHLKSDIISVLKLF